MRLWKSALLAIVLFGITSRVAQYAWRASLWHDEALVTLNVMHRDYRELLRPLDYEQAAPPLFLWGERWMYLHLGFGEYQLRLISLICGVTSVMLFGWLAWRLFPPPVAVAVAAFLALCDKVIWHSAQVKQYSGDVLVAVVLLCLAIGLRRPVLAAARLWLVAAMSAILLWFSFPAVFVFAAISLMLLPEMLRQAPWKRMPRWLVAIVYLGANLLVLVSFGLMYRLTVRGHAGYLDRYWSEHFADWSKPWLVPAWIVREIYSLCDHPYRSLGWLVLPLAVLGAVELYRSGRANVVWAAAGPIGFCMAAGLAGKYPFTGERITVFLAPGLFILVGAGLEWLRGRERTRKVWFVPAVPLVLVGVGFSASYLIDSHSRSSIRAVAQFLREHRRPGEAICLVGEGTEPDSHFRSGRNLELLCYWPDVPGPLYGAPETPPLKDVSEIREKRFWIVFAALPKHHSRYMQGLLADARSVAVEVEKKEIPGGGAFLFERR